MNSIILTHKNRPAHLKLCIEALDDAAQQCKQPIEVVLMDQSDPEAPDAIDLIEIGMDKLLLQWHWEEPTDGLFHKSRLINQAVAKATGDYVTMMDVDIIVPPNFLSVIEDFYADPTHQGMKLGHRVRMVTEPYTKRFHQRGLAYLVDAAKKAFNLATEYHKTIPTGCAISTIAKADFHRIGGYDERFIGWGLEDCDYNLRAHKNGIETKLNDKCEVFHLHHNRTPDWKNDRAYEANFALFQRNMNDGHPNPPPHIPAPAESVKQSCCYRSKG